MNLKPELDSHVAMQPNKMRFQMSFRCTKQHRWGLVSFASLTAIPSYQLVDLKPELGSHVATQQDAVSGYFRSAVCNLGARDDRIGERSKCNDFVHNKLNITHALLFFFSYWPSLFSIRL